MLVRVCEGDSAIVAFVPLAAYFYKGNVVASDSAADMRYHSIQLVLGTLSLGKLNGLRIDHTIRQFYQHVVLVCESFEVQLSKRDVTSKMLGYTFILSVRLAKLYWHVSF